MHAPRYLALCLVVALVGCGSDAVPTETTSTTGLPATTTSPAITTTTIASYTPGDTLPLFVTASYFPVEALSKVSRFRSGHGHDYGDAFESCVSLKHYFVADQALDHTTLEIRSPVEGVIEEVITERLADGGSQLRIRVSAAPAFRVYIFHVATDVAPGTEVVAGDLLGHHIGNFTASDIAVFTDLGDNRFQAVSVFEVMTDDVFGLFAERSDVAREDFIISAAERDLDPLTCDEHGNFADPGNIENWVDLSG